jgi:hypothetical protein
MRLIATSAVEALVIGEEDLPHAAHPEPPWRTR